MSMPVDQEEPGTIPDSSAEILSREELLARYLKTGCFDCVMSCAVLGEVPALFWPQDRGGPPFVSIFLNVSRVTSSTVGYWFVNA